jgi:hypothetical protein
MHFEAVKCVKKSLKDDEVFISVMCCSSIMSGNPPPGHGGEGPTLGHFHFLDFFFQKCGGMWFYKEIGGMFLCKNTNRVQLEHLHVV